MGLVFWTNKEGHNCTTSLAKASELLRDLFNRWPHGLIEIEASLNGTQEALVKAKARIAELENLCKKPTESYEIRFRSSSKLGCRQPWSSWIKVEERIGQLCVAFPVQSDWVFETRCSPVYQTVNKLVISTQPDPDKKVKVINTSLEN